MAHKLLRRAWATAADLLSTTVADREIVVVTDDYSLVVGDGVTLGGRVRFLPSPAAVSPTYSAPSSGATLTMAASARSLIINPAATIATLTVVLPPSPGDGQAFELRSSKTVTAITVNGAGAETVTGGTGMLSANGRMSWIYRATGTTWFGAN